MKKVKKAPKRAPLVVYAIAYETGEAWLPYPTDKEKTEEVLRGLHHGYRMVKLVESPT